MNDLRNIIIMVSGAFLSLVSPIQDFMEGMLILFAVNFIFGLVAARCNDEEWSWRKVGMCFVYCLIFFGTVAAMFIVGHFMHAEEQALACVKYIGSPAKACGLIIDSRKSKQEEFSVYDASELRSKLFDFCIEGFRRSIGRTVDEIV